MSNKSMTMCQKTPSDANLHSLLRQNPRRRTEERKLNNRKAGTQERVREMFEK